MHRATGAPWTVAWVRHTIAPKLYHGPRHGLCHPKLGQILVAPREIGVGTRYPEDCTHKSPSTAFKVLRGCKVGLPWSVLVYTFEGSHRVETSPIPGFALANRWFRLPLVPHCPPHSHLECIFYNKATRITTSTSFVAFCFVACRNPFCSCKAQGVHVYLEACYGQKMGQVIRQYPSVLSVNGVGRRSGRQHIDLHNVTLRPICIQKCPIVHHRPPSNHVPDPHPTH